MRILHIIPQLSGGGAERQLCYLAPELAELGHDVHVAFTRDGPSRPDLPNVTLHHVTSRSSYDPVLLWKLIRLTKSLQPDVVHSWILQSDVLGGIAARLNRTAWVLREPGSAAAHPPSLKNLLRIAMASTADTIVSNSTEGDRYWARQLPRSNRVIVPNGFPIAAIAASPPVRLDSDLPLVLYAGRLAADGSANKNLRVLIRALKELRELIQFQSIICGDGPQVTELKQMVRDLQLTEHVRFAGYQSASQVWSLMRAATVFASLSAHEGSPNTVMEAILCGCMLVLSDIPAHRTVADEALSSFVDASDPRLVAEAIAHEVRRAPNLADERERKRLEANQWSIARMAERYQHVYQSIL